MIELIPAIDIINGQCVRLTCGDYDAQTVYSKNPTDVAKHIESLGFKRLHVVDLDGAKSHHIVNEHVLKDITSQTRLKVDFGGGIKTQEDIEKAFAAGASMVTIGSVAVTQPELFVEWLNHYGAHRIILGADVRYGKISVNGWKQDSEIDLFAFLEQPRCNTSVVYGYQQRWNPFRTCHRAICRYHETPSHPAPYSQRWCFVDCRHP